MIRVNLLPHAGERRTAQPSQLWLVVVMLLVVVEIIGLFFYHQTLEDELKAAQDEVKTVSDEVKAINALVKDHKKVKAALEELRAREDAIAKLQSGRKGPTDVLSELSRVLTRSKGPTLSPVAAKQPANPMDTYNLNWDTRRVWLTGYAESERSVRLEGMARDGNDVSELAQRLKRSIYFDAVTLLPGQEETDSDTKVALVKWALQAKVKY